MAFSLNLANFAADLTKVATAVETAVTDAQQVYSYASKVIAAAETAYASQTGAGATKRVAVLAATEAFATALGANWSLLEGSVSAWIDVVIAGYNAVADVIGTPAVNQTAVDSAVTAVNEVAAPVVSTVADVAEAVSAPAAAAPTPTIQGGL